MYCFYAGDEEPKAKTFFTFLGKNIDIDTSMWRLFRADRKPGGFSLYLGVPEESLKVLDDTRYELYYGAGRLDLKRSFSDRGTARTGVPSVNSQ